MSFSKYSRVKFRAKRRGVGVSIVVLAGVSGASTGTICGWESGHWRPKDYILAVIWAGLLALERVKRHYADLDILIDMTDARWLRAQIRKLDATTASSVPASPPAVLPEVLPEVTD